MILSSVITVTASIVSGLLGFTGTIAATVCTTLGYLGAIAIYGVLR